MEAEFDTVAGWTESVVRELGADYAIPAACRGSGQPSWLRWIADALRLRPIDRFLDAGAGLGGPAAWLRENHGVDPVHAEPMTGACLGARRLFGRPTVAAWSQALPFRDGTFDAAWLLGVLCATRAKVPALTELRRVLVPGGRLGLLVLVQTADELPDAPEGNVFPTHRSLLENLWEAGFTVESQTGTGRLAEASTAWSGRVRRVEELLEGRYADREAYRQAHEQEQRIGRLLNDGLLETTLLSLRSA